VDHRHVYDHTKTIDHRYYGVTVTLWRMHFVNVNADLSKVRCCVLLLSQALTRLGIGVATRRQSEWKYGLGQLTGLRLGLGPFLAGRSLVPLLERPWPERSSTD
jgi:hypothetical protein